MFFNLKSVLEEGLGIYTEAHQNKSMLIKMHNRLVKEQYLVQLRKFKNLG